MRRFAAVGLVLCLVMGVGWVLLAPTPTGLTHEHPAPAVVDEPAAPVNTPTSRLPSGVHQPASGERSEPEDVPDAAGDAGMEEPRLANTGLVQGQSAWPMTKDGIDGAFREVLPGIRGCYEDALQEVPDLEGGFKVLFRVDDREGIGSVVHVEITDMNSDAFTELHDLPMEDCVMDVMHTLQFDAPADGPVEVRYPLVFNAG